MGSLNVTNKPQAVYPFGEQDAFVITNNGPYTVYVDQDSSIGNQSHPIPPTGVMVWDANRPLWIVGADTMADGSFSDVTLTRNSSPSSFTNFVDTVLYEAVSPAGTGFLTATPLIETSAYRFIIVRMACPETQIDNPGAGQPFTAYFNMDVAWYDNRGNYLSRGTVTCYPFVGVGSGGGIEDSSVRIVMPVKGAYCTLYPTTTGQITLRVVGSTRELTPGQAFGAYDPGIHVVGAGDSPIYFIGERSLSLSLFGSGIALYQVWIPNLGPKVRVAVRYTATPATTVAGSMNIRDQRDTSIWYTDTVAIPVGGSATVGNIEWVLPLYSPLTFIVALPTPVVNVTLFDVSLTWYDC